MFHLTSSGKFKNKLSYRKYDSDALNISRSAAGSPATKTTSPNGRVSLTIRWSADHIDIHHHPCSEDEQCSVPPARRRTKDTGLHRVERNFEPYKDTDGYSLHRHGNGLQVKKIDARYIMFNGDDPTLGPTDIVVFEVVPRKGKTG